MPSHEVFHGAQSSNPLLGINWSSQAHSSFDSAGPIATQMDPPLRRRQQPS
ncbi:hypothetical protein C1H46_008573 [Malus baccata]|uniref:Uncharacterized protein n=1 Tax=Malus baccata TaxID=106549 RepID=A0A540N5W2_MALBA|nr:hypothetical protein C1H46_008573 [Malus baccata]